MNNFTLRCSGVTFACIGEFLSISKYNQRESNEIAQESCGQRGESVYKTTADSMTSQRQPAWLGYRPLSCSDEVDSSTSKGLPKCTQHQLSASCSQHLLAHFRVSAFVRRPTSI